MSKQINKIIYSDRESKEKVLKGMFKVIEPIANSMGAKGCYTTFEFNNQLYTINDGFSISKMVTPLADKLENIGANYAISAGMETNFLAGDSTSLAEHLTGWFSRVAHGLVSDENVDRHVVYNVLDKIKKQFIEFLDKVVDRDITEKKLINTAIISCKEKELGELIGGAVFETGEFGSVIPKRKSTPGFEIEDYPGYLVDTSFSKDALFDNQKTMISSFKNPYIMLYDGRIEDPRHIYPVIRMAIREENKMKGKPILLFCKGIVQSVLEVVYSNFINSGATIYVMEIPSVDKDAQNVLEDLSVITGCEVLGEDRGRPVLTNDKLGNDLVDHPELFIKTHPEVVVRRGETIMVYNKEDVASRKDISNHIEKLKSEYDLFRGKTDEKYKIPMAEIQARITKLESKMKILRFGGDSQDRLNTLEFQIEDAIHTARVAYKDGIIVGGGLTLVKFRELNNIFADDNFPKRWKAQSKYKFVNYLRGKLWDKHILKLEKKMSVEDVVYNELLTVFNKPAWQILHNAGITNLIKGFDGHWEHRRLAKQNKGYNIHNNETLEVINYEDAGIFDAKKGIEIAVVKAITTAQQFTLTNHFVVNDEEDKNNG